MFDLACQLILFLHFFKRKFLESEQSKKPKDLELKPPSSKSPRLEQVNYFGKVDEKDESVIIEEEMLEPEPESTEPETSDTSDRPESVTSDVIIGHWLKKPNESMEMSPNKTGMYYLVKMLGLFKSMT